MRSRRLARGEIGIGSFLALAAGALLAMSACRSNEAPASPPPSPEGFEMLSPGVEPRAALRYRLTAGTRSRSTLRVLAEPLGNLRPIPAVRFTTETEILPAAGDGAFPVQIRVTEAEAEAGSAPTPSTTEDALARLRGVELRATASPGGKLSHLELRSAAGGAADAELQTLSTTMQQLAVELPGPEVGVGASWAIERPFPQGGLALKARTVYQLVELTATGARLRSQVLLWAPDQKVQQGEQTAELAGFTGKGEADLSIDFTSLTATGTTTSSYQGRVTTEGRTVELGMKLSVTLGRD